LRDPKAECAVCFERLGGKSVTVLRCLHHFDKTCVARLIAANSARGGGGASARTVTCPLCRVPTRRKNMCTFIHRHVRAQGSAEGDEETEDEEEEETETEAPIHFTGGIQARGARRPSRRHTPIQPRG